MPSADHLCGQSIVDCGPYLHAVDILVGFGRRADGASVMSRSSHLNKDSESILEVSSGLPKDKRMACSPNVNSSRERRIT